MEDEADSALEGDLELSVGQLGVESLDDVDSRLDELSALLVHGDLVDWVSGTSVSDSSASDHGWVQEVLEEGIVNCSQSPVSWSDLGGVSLDSLGDDGSQTNEEGRSVLLLDLQLKLHDVLLGISQRWIRDSDQNALDGLLVTILEGDFSSSCDLDVLQLLLQVRLRAGKLSDVLGDFLLDGGWVFLLVIVILP